MTSLFQIGLAQGFFVLANVVAFCLSIFQLHAESKLPETSNTEKAIKRGILRYSFRRLALVVSFLLVVQCIDPFGNTDVLPYVLINILTNLVSASIYAGLYLIFYVLSQGIYVLLMKELPKAAVYSLLILTVVAYIMAVVVAILASVYKKHGITAILLLYFALTTLACLVPINYSVFRLHRYFEGAAKELVGNSEQSSNFRSTVKLCATLTILGVITASFQIYFASRRIANWNAPHIPTPLRNFSFFGEVVFIVLQDVCLFVAMWFAWLPFSKNDADERLAKVLGESSPHRYRPSRGVDRIETLKQFKFRPNAVIVELETDEEKYTSAGTMVETLLPSPTSTFAESSRSQSLPELSKVSVNTDTDSTTGGDKN